MKSSEHYPYAFAARLAQLFRANYRPMDLQSLPDLSIPSGIAFPPDWEDACLGGVDSFLRGLGS